MPYKLTFKEIYGKYYYMITDPSSGDNQIEHEYIDPSIISIMDILENISDTYTEICVNRARSTKDYDKYKNYMNRRKSSMIHINEEEFISSSAGPTICSYKAFIVSFIYLYIVKNRIPPWFFFSRRKQYLKDISEYANNFSFLLNFNKILPETFSEEVPNGSCIGYMLEYLNDEVCAFQHAFVMIAVGDYFIIYDAWAGIRTKCLRAMTKSQTKEILNSVNLVSCVSKDLEKFELLNYFFLTNINSSGYFACNGVLHFHYIELESEKFKETYENSQVEIMFGGRTRVSRKREFKRTNKKLKVNRKHRTQQKCR